MQLSKMFGVAILSCASLIPVSSAWAQEKPQSPASQAQTFSGTLVDADCKANDQKAACPVADMTSTFGLVFAGKYVKLDAEGNAKVKSMLLTSKVKTGSIPASVAGTMDGDTLKVETVQIPQSPQEK